MTETWLAPKKVHRFAQKKRIPGEPYAVKSKTHARVMVALGNADYCSAQHREVKQQPSQDVELAAMRNEYKTRVGKRPYHGWGVEELRSRMYNRRDMRAED